MIVRGQGAVVLNWIVPRMPCKAGPGVQQPGRRELEPSRSRFSTQQNFPSLVATGTNVQDIATVTGKYLSTTGHLPVQPFSTWIERRTWGFG
jgi:hypothetical protein